MANKIIITATKAHTNKNIEYLHPITNTYQDSNILENIPAGSYTNIRARLKNAIPEIFSLFLGNVQVFDPAIVYNAGRGYDEGIPIMRLTAPNFANLNKIDKQTVDCEIVNANGSNYSGSQLYKGKVDIKGAGNSTWQQPKKPINITFPNKIGVLGMPGSKKYRFLAGTYDYTFLHNAMMLDLGNQMGVVAPQARPVIIEVNGEFYGYGDLTEKADQKVVDTYGSNGSYVGVKAAADQEDLTMSNWFQTPLYGDNYSSVVPNGSTRGMIMEVPEFGKQTDAQFDYFKNLVLAAENSLNYPWSDLVNGPQKYFDKESTIKYYLICEWAKQFDAEGASAYYHVRPNTNKIFFGSLWDFDASFLSYTIFNGYANPEELWVGRTPWFRYLVSNVTFLADCKQYLDSNIHFFNEAMLFAKRRAQLLIDTGIQVQDKNKWGIWNYSQNIPLSTGVGNPDYNFHTTIFYNYMTTRLNWLKSYVVDKTAQLSQSGTFYLDNGDGIGYMLVPAMTNLKTVKIVINSSVVDPLVTYVDSGGVFGIKGSQATGMYGGSCRVDGIPFSGNLESIMDGNDHSIVFQLDNYFSNVQLGVFAHFQGTLKSFEFFNRNLSDAECTQQYVLDGLIVAYHGLFKDGMLVDETGGGRNATPVNCKIGNITRS